MKSFSIIGAGKVGTSLGRALVEAGYTIKSLSCLTLTEAKESQRIIGKGEPSKNNIHAAQNGEILFITVPDDRITDIVQELDFSDIIWQEKTVFHCSGLLPSEILLGQKGPRQHLSILYNPSLLNMQHQASSKMFISAWKARKKPFSQPKISHTILEVILFGSHLRINRCSMPPSA